MSNPTPLKFFMLNFFVLFFMGVDQIFQGNILVGDEKVPRFLPYVFSKFFPAEKVRGPGSLPLLSRIKNRAKADNKGDFKELYQDFDIIFEITFIIGL